MFIGSAGYWISSGPGKYFGFLFLCYNEGIAFRSSVCGKTERNGRTATFRPTAQTPRWKMPFARKRITRTKPATGYNSPTLSCLAITLTEYHGLAILSIFFRKREIPIRQAACPKGQFRHCRESLRASPPLGSRLRASNGVPNADEKSLQHPSAKVNEHNPG